MSYEAWRISFQNSEQAARAAYRQLQTVSEHRDTIALHAAALFKALAYGSDYLDENKFNSIGHGSKAHQEMRAAIELKLDTSCLAKRDMQQQIKALSDESEAIIKEFQATDTLTANQVYQRLADRGRELRRVIEQQETTPCPK